MANIRALRLTVVDVGIARQLFQLMARVFEEPSEPLSDEYLVRLLSRPDFWALAAFMDDEMVGGLTAYTLPMTRQPLSEIFIYDIAVRSDRQRKGVGRMLISTLRAAAEAEGIHEIFVPADNEDKHALDFYRSLGGEPAGVTFFAVRFGPVDAPVNALGLRRIMFAVDGIDDVVARMQARGAELIGQMQYGNSYRLAYIRGPEGIIVGLAEQLG